jgi:hypothetical protein
MSFNDVVQKVGFLETVPGPIEIENDHTFDGQVFLTINTQTHRSELLGIMPIGPDGPPTRVHIPTLGTLKVESNIRGQLQRYLNVPQQLVVTNPDNSVGDLTCLLFYADFFKMSTPILQQITAGIHINIVNDVDVTANECVAMLRDAFWILTDYRTQMEAIKYIYPIEDFSDVCLRTDADLIEGQYNYVIKLVYDRFAERKGFNTPGEVHAFVGKRINLENALKAGFAHAFVAVVRRLKQDATRLHLPNVTHDVLRNVEYVLDPAHLDVLHFANPPLCPEIHAVVQHYSARRDRSDHTITQYLGALRNAPL